MYARRIVGQTISNHNGSVNGATSTSTATKAKARDGAPMKLARPPIPPKKKAVRARAWRKEGVGGSPRRSRFATLRGKNSRHARAVVPQLRDKPRPSVSAVWHQDILPNRQTGAAKQFSIPFKRKKVARKNKELKRKLFCFARRVSADGNAERS